MWNIILDFDGRFWCTDGMPSPAYFLTTPPGPQNFIIIVTTIGTRIIGWGVGIWWPHDD